MINFYLYHNDDLDNCSIYQQPLSYMGFNHAFNGFEKIMHIIRKDPYHATLFACYKINGRWPEAEPYIMKNPYWAVSYAVKVIHHRWLEAEPYIMEDPFSAYHYASDIMGHRWVQAEHIIGQDADWWKPYCERFEL